MEGNVNTPNDGTDGTSAKAEDDAGNGAPLLDDERKKLADEFNVQRAKMKELFLQKEVEMRSMLEEREQLQSEVLGLRAELQQLQTLSENQKSEMESLQLLIHETVEASSSGSEEVRRLTARNLELEQQLNLIARERADKTTTLQDAPAALVRSLARRLGGEPDPEDPPPDRRVNKYSQEDVELLRSLVEPLEEEIKALKEKLRDTDNQLQLATQSKKAKGDSKEGEMKCDMCLNYEKQLVAEQTRCEESRLRAANAERALKTAISELEGARCTHEESLAAWRGERGAARAQVEALRGAVEGARRGAEEAAGAAARAQRDAVHAVTSLTVQRELLQEKIDTLQKDNDMLIGKYSKKALELQNEDIDLPDTVEALHEHILRQREQLIVTSLSRDAAAAAAAELRAQLLQQGELFHAQTARHAKLHADHQQARQQLDRLENERDQMKDLGDKLHRSNDKIEELLNDKKRLQNEVMELRNRISSLQQDLDNSEKVQQDFVRLSQSLQVQLERIRAADTEVRWQLEDDVTECPSCHAALPHNKLKVHCRHCGRIFCASCLVSSVPAGPRRRDVRVCELCRTLLVPHAPPYFSTQPPRSPD